MSLIDPKMTAAAQNAHKPVDKDIKVEPSEYRPSELERKVRAQVLKDFALGYQTMYRPRQEFSDLSCIQRDQVDFMAFNTYQPNNGENAPGDVANSWRSNAIRPIERIKAMSMAGHAAEHLGFLRLQAADVEANPDDDAALVMNSALDWVRSTYMSEDFWLHAVLQAEVSPACIVHEEYRETYRQAKTVRGKDGKWQYEPRQDEANSGFVATIVPTDQLFIENVYEKDLQKQRFVIWRRIMSHDQLEAKYGHLPQWKHVRKGMQQVFNDANQGFYFAYDPNLRGELGEEVTWWAKADGGSRVVMVNGVVMGEADAKNPREDGLYPFAKFFYSWVRDNFFYGKSLVFSVSKDANIINTLYPVLVDAAILDTMKPMKYVGKDVIGSDVIIPGSTVSMSDPNAKLEPLLPPANMNSTLMAMGQVEKSLDQTANTQAVPGENRERVTAYEMSLREAQVKKDLGPFFAELIGMSIQMTRLVLGDILQHMTVADVGQMQGPKAGLRYKSFLVNLKGGGKVKSRRVKFEKLKDGMTEDELMGESYALLKEQGGLGSETEVVKADPVRIRNRKYSMLISDEVLKPKSDDVRFKQNLETVDKVIALKGAGANIDMDVAAKKLLFSSNPVTARDPDSFIMKAQAAGGIELPPGMPPIPGMGQPNQMPQQAMTQ
jgi:hypothetical protein